MGRRCAGSRNPPPRRAAMRLGVVALLAGACVPSAYDRDLVTQLDREILALKDRNDTLSERLDNCDAEGHPGEIYPQLVQVFSGTEVEVSHVGVRAVLVIPSEVLFSSGSVQVREEATMVVDLLATALGLHEDRHVWIISHTDSPTLSSSMRRRYGSHWGLTTAMSASFMSSLVDMGVAETRFTIAGQGASSPRKSSDTPEGAGRNRRVVVVIGPPGAWG